MRKPISSIFYPLSIQHELRSMSYTVGINDPPPKAGEYLVSIGKKGIGTVYKIYTVSLIRHKILKGEQAYQLKVHKIQGLKEYVEYDEMTNQVFVKGEPANPCFWNPRGKK